MPQDLSFTPAPRFVAGPPTGTGLLGQVWYDTSTMPWTAYVWRSNVWNRFTVVGLGSAELIVSANVTAQTLTTQSVAYPWTTGWTHNIAPEGLTVDNAAGTITAHTAGRFCSLATINWSSDALDGYHIGIYKNGVLIAEHLATVDVLSINKAMTTTITGIDTAVPGDVFDIRILDGTAGGSNVTFYNVNFSIFAIG